MIPKLDHVKCVLMAHADKPRRTWCGKEISSFEWVFQDSTHALLNAEQGGYLLMCPDCSKALADAVEKAVFGDSPKGDAARLSLQDAAIDVARAHELWRTCGPEELEEARDAFHEACQRLEEVAKGSHSTAKGFLQKNALMAVVRGQLKTTITDHGPISLQFVESAARRICGGIIGHLRQASLRETSNEAARLEVKRMSQEIKDLEENVRKKGDQIKHFVAKLQSLGIPLGDDSGEGSASPT